jgi:hypothetical protein
VKQFTPGQQTLAVVGCSLALGGVLADMFFDAPDSLVDPLTIGGGVLMVIALWRSRKRGQPTPTSTRRDKWKRFALLFVAVCVAAVVSFIGLRRKFPDFSLNLQLGICAFTFLFCIGFFYWQLFMRREK